MAKRLCRHARSMALGVSDHAVEQRCQARESSFFAALFGPILFSSIAFAWFAEGHENESCSTRDRYSFSAAVVISNEFASGRD
jgi:hypothetical protein